MSDAWIRETPEGVTLSVKVIPRAKRTEVVGPHGDALKIRVQAPPVEGAANAALVKFLSKGLGIPKGRVVIQAGEASRQKVILISGLGLEPVRNFLGH